MQTNLHDLLSVPAVKPDPPVLGSAGPEAENGQASSPEMKSAGQWPALSALQFGYGVMMLNTFDQAEVPAALTALTRKK